MIPEFLIRLLKVTGGKRLKSAKMVKKALEVAILGVHFAAVVNERRSPDELAYALCPFLLLPIPLHFLNVSTNFYFRILVGARL